MLKAGTATIDVTPATGCMLQGYERERRGVAVAAPLEVNALAVGAADPEWVLLTADVLGLSRDFTRPLRERIAAALDLAPAAVTVACSHTHSGPAVMRLGSIAADDTYLERLAAGLEAAARSAAAGLAPASWRFGTATLDENVNRRVRTRAGVVPGVNCRGAADKRLRVLRLDAPGVASCSPPLALVVHYACHATAGQADDVISPDWPGAMRTALQCLHGQGERRATVLFVSGCAGDVTHRIGRDPDRWPGRFGRHTQAEAATLGRLAAAAAVAASETSVAWRAETVRVAETELELRFAARQASEKTSLQMVCLGPDGAAGRERDELWLAGLPGEPFGFYQDALGSALRRRLGADRDRVLVGGCVNDAVGYLGSARDLSHGGYEVEKAPRLYHRPGPFDGSTEKRIVKAAVEAADICLSP